MTGPTPYNDARGWNWKDAAALGLVIGAHLLGLWQFIRAKPAPPPPEPVPLQVSLVIPPEEPPPPEPPKPPPPREQPKPPPKEVPKPVLQPPPVVTDTPVAKPIEPLPPAPPPPPQPAPAPQTAPPANLALQVMPGCKEPEYPRKARQNGLGGTVTLRISVNKNGDAEKVEIAKSSGFFELDNAARAALGRCKFVPYKLNGVAVDVVGYRDYVFKLQ